MGNARLRRTLATAIPLAVAAAWLLLGCGGDESSPRASAASGAARIDARVQRVVDGDTLKVRLSDGRSARVRLVGIDTPETKKPEHADPVRRAAGHFADEPPGARFQRSRP